MPRYRLGSRGLGAAQTDGLMGGRRPKMRAHLVRGVPIGQNTAQNSEEVAQKAYLGPKVTQNAFECSPFSPCCGRMVER